MAFLQTVFVSWGYLYNTSITFSNQNKNVLRDITFIGSQYSFTINVLN